MKFIIHLLKIQLLLLLLVDAFIAQCEALYKLFQSLFLFILRSLQELENITVPIAQICKLRDMVMKFLTKVVYLADIKTSI